MSHDIDKIARELAGGLSLDQLRQRQQNPFAPRTVTPRTSEQIEKEEAYWQEVFSRPETQGRNIEIRYRRKFEQEMSYEDARTRFWAIMQFRAAEISQIENRNFDWVIGNDLADRIKAMLRYFINDPACPWPLNKGLFIFGQNGTGKTEIMQMFSRFCSQYGLNKQFIISSMSRIYTDCKANSNYDPVEQNVQFDRCFDEFGRHVGPVMRYGDAFDVNEALLEERYDRHKRYGQITHLISNMQPNEAEGKFSPVIFDRLRSMCNSVPFTGKSMR